jgi:beta-galactosidase
VVTRRSEDGDYVTVINHGEADAAVPLAGHELLTGADVGMDGGAFVVPAGQVRVVRRA